MTKQKTKAQLSMELEEAQKRIAELEQVAHLKARGQSQFAEQDRQEDEALYRTFIEQTNDGVIILDEQGNVSVWNSAQESIMGISREEAIGRKYWETQYRLSTPETRARLSLENIKDALQSTFKTGEYPDLGQLREVEIQVEDGSRKFIQISPFTVKTENGYRIGAITRDITEQRRAANLSRENEERFTHVFHASPAQMAITDGNTGKYIDVNEAFLQSLGFTREEVVGKTATELNLFFDPNQRASLLGKMKEQGYLRGEDVLVCTKNGGLRHGVFSAEYIQVQDHPFLLTAMNDVTERKQMEEMLYKNQQTLLETQSVAKLQSWVANFQTGEFIIGPGYDHILEQAPGIYKMDDIKDLIHTQDRESVERAWEQAAQNQLLDIEYRILTSGELKWIHTKTIHSEDRKNIWVPGFTQDITERRQAEEITHAQRNLARLASTTTSQTESLPYCLDAALRVSGMDCGGIYLFDSNRQTLELAYHQGLGQGFIQAVSHYEADAPNVQMVLAGMMFYFGESDLQNQKLYLDEGLRSLVIIPVIDHGHTLGCINIGSHAFHQVPESTRQPIETIVTEIGAVIAHLQTEALLRDSEEKYRSLINSQESTIFTIDGDGILHYINRIGAAQLATDAEKIVGRKLQEFFPPQVADWLLNHVHTVISSEQGLVTEYQSVVGGNPEWQRVSIQPIHGATGQFTLAMVNSLDITERKKSESALQNSQEQLRLALIAAHMGTWKWSISTNKVEWSPEASRLFGLKDLNADLNTVLDFFHPEDKIQVLNSIQNAISNRKVTNGAYRIQHADGHTMWVTNFGHVKYDTNGNAIAISGLIQDITELKEAEESLWKSTQILQESQSIANLGSWTADLTTGIFDATPEGAHLVGWAEGKHSSDELMDTIHPDDREYMQNSWAAAMQGVPYDIEHRIILNGEVRWLRVKAKIKFDEQGAPISALGITQDVTERKQAEERRRESDDRYRLLFETMVQGVVFQDVEGRIIHANSSAEEILGMTLAQMQGRASIDPRWRTIHEDGRLYPGENHPAMIALRSGESVYNSVMGVYNVASESYRWINVNAVPRFRNGDDKPYQVYTTFEDITERKQAENALISSEKKLQSLIDSQTHFVLRINLEGKYTFWNQKFEREFGWRHKNKGIENASPLDTINSYHHQRVLDVVKNCINQPGLVFSVEIDKPAEDGSTRTTLWEFIGLTDEHNQPSEIQCMGVEITDRKKAEEALRESEEKYRLLAENISDVIWIMDIESSKFNYVSSSVLQLRGYSTDEVLVQGVSASLTPASDIYLIRVIAERLVEFEQGIIKVYTDELEHPCRDGSTVWTESTTRFIKNPETGKLEVYGVSRNITDRKKVEAAIHQIEKRNTSLIENAPDGIALVDEDGIFMFASPSAYRMLGYSTEEIVGTPSRKWVHPSDLPMLANLRNKLAARPAKPQMMEYRFQHKDGSYRWLEATYTNMCDEPSVQGIVINFRDMTDRKLAAETSRQQGEHIRLLYEASKQLNRTLDLKEIYQTICDFMSIIAPSDTLFISAFDEKTELITCNAYWMRGTWLDVTPFPPIPLEGEGKGTQSRVIRSGQPMLLSDYQKFLKTSDNIYYINDETNEIQTDEPEEEDITRSALIVPLKSGGGVRGIFQVSSYQLNAYTESQLQLLEALSLHIASAEQNALLYNQLVAELEERRQTGEALRRSEALLSEAQRIGRIGHMEWNGKDQTLICSDEVYDILGLPRGFAITQSTIGGMMTKEDRDALQKTDIGSIQQRKDMNYEYRIRLNDGRERWLHQQGKVTYNEAGIPVRMMAIIQDITERKLTEETLRETQNHIELALKGANAAMWDWKIQSGETIFNERWAEIIGYTLQELEPISINTWEQLCHPDDMKISSELLQKHFTGETEYYECEARMKHKNGTWVWVLDRGRVMEWDAEKKPVRMFGTHLDISERKHEERYTQARLKLSNAAHEEVNMETLMKVMLDEAEALTDSSIGFFHFVDEDQNTISLQAWSSNTLEKMCTAEGHGSHYPVAEAGIWADCIRKGAACIYNNYESVPNHHNMPSGHAPVTRLISLPIIRNNIVVAALGIGNKSSDYDQNDLDMLKRLAEEAFDIILRKRAEQYLRASEEKYRVLIKSLDNVIASVDREGKFLYMNDMAVDQLGISTENLTGKSMYDLFPESVASQQMMYIQQVLNEDKGNIYEDLTFVRGKPRWHRTSIQPIHNEEGRASQVLINSTDIHDLKTAQQELQELNRTLEERVKERTAEVQDLYDNAPAGYHSLDINGYITLINQTQLKWMGFTRKEMTGRPLAAFLTPSSALAFDKNFPLFQERGVLKDVELEFVRKDGTILPALVNATAVYDQQGIYATSRSTVLDNTGQKAVAEAMHNANLELARAMRMKDEFLASMSHELRTPLNGILGLSEALQLDVYGPLNEKQKSTLGHVEDSGRHLLELINDILDVSKIEAGKFELEMLPCSLGDICQSSIHLTKGMAGKKRQNVNFTMNPASININADARRLKQVLVNLLSNAVKFTPESGSLGLEVTKNETDNIVFISVWDNGIGISPEDIKKLFQPFVQLDSSLSRQQTGTGLGLTLVQRLVEMHGGSIEIQSNPGQGSRFTVALPCLSENSIPENFDNITQSRFHFALIVEDETMDAGHLARYCRTLGINPILHSTGKGALERAIATRPNIVFLDLNLPDISGWDVLTQLKNNPETRHIPVVITSVDDEKQRASQFNVDGYLVKFFAISDLRAVLDNIQKASSTEGMSTPQENQITATVMIVDDNEINIETVVDYLSSKNFNVVSSHSGVDFLTRVSHIQPDIILMDIQMPEIDGLETTRRLRAIPDQKLASVPVIALTALAMPGDRELCIEAGADEYVTKPFRLRELHELITQILDDKKRAL